MHHIQPKCPEKLGVVMREVLLSHVEELLFGITRELRPALAVCDPTWPFVDRGHSSSNVAAWQ
jgi:hypothetical protein